MRLNNRWVSKAGALTLLVVVGLLAGCGSSNEAPTSPAAYDIKPFNEWPQDEKEKKVGQYLESAWHDPAVPVFILTVDSRATGDEDSKSADAELAQLQTSKIAGYRERGVKKVRIGDRPTIQWAFVVGGEAWIEFFFEECDTSFIVRGVSSPYAFKALSESYREMTSTIKVKGCDE